MKRLVLGLIVSLVVAGSVSAYVRNGPGAVKLVPGVNTERVATQWRVVSLGEKSVYVPAERGGTGQRFLVDVWALQVRGLNGVWADLEWHWGEPDLVVAYLESRLREEQTKADVRLFNQPGYQHYFEFSGTFPPVQ